jgi:ACT domain-containing protein
LIAQSKIDKKISGLVTDSLTKGSLPNATVMLIKSDSLLIGTKSKSDGSFVIKQRLGGAYVLKIQYVGYTSKTIIIDLQNEDIDLSVINMSLSQIALSEIKVIGKKPFIEFLEDRVSMNVSESITGVGGNVLDILKKAPYIMVDMNGGVTLKGKANPQILIDGKPTNYAGDVSKLLESMPSGSVDKIEIITNPSAKYEAEGRGSGVINIKTLKGKALGFNGNINSGIGMGEKYRYNAGIDLNYRSEKYNIFGNYNRIDFQQYAYFHITTFIDKLFIDNYADRNQHQFNNTFKVGVDYQINKKNSLGFLATGFQNISNMTILTDTRFMPINTSLIDSSQTTDADIQTKGSNIAINFNYIHNFNTNGKTLKIDVDYLKNNNIPNQDFFINYLYNKGVQVRKSSFYRNGVFTNLNLGSFSLDFENPFKNGKKLELGLKVRTTWLSNDSKFDILSNNIWVNDTRRNSLYDYQENVNAVYINYKTNLKNINLSMGMRMENTNLDGFSVTQNERLTRNYVQFFPNISFQNVIDKNNTITLSYRQSISRPSYEQFNPFVWYHTNYSNSKGNPALKPSLDNVISLEYNNQKKWFFSCVYTMTKDYVGFIRKFNAETKIITETFENFDNTNNLYLDFIYNSNITKWWRINIELAPFHQTVKGIYENRTFTNTNLYLEFVYSNVFKLGKGFTTELGGSYRSGWIQSIYYTRPTTTIDLGFSKNILNDQGSLKFNITDIFNQLIIVSDVAVINHVISRKNETRYFRLNFTYKFGNNNVKKSQNRQTGIGSESRRIVN